ncbi:MAG: hypothetical protein SPI08_07545 [Campylobacter sp.]|nr:hypothetical protein [Campylobacter sp.]MCI6340656.1 hypothetical protein [Campylobacter sp.]MCI7103624.1 hypothetical protein [Campylobacter sp.]MDY6124370.1 hypothetical protein [Campylobacter sp.]
MPFLLFIFILPAVLPCGAVGWLSFYALFTLKALRSPAPYAETFTCFCSLMLQKLS